MKTMLLVFPYGMAQKICVQQRLWDKMLYLTLKQKPIEKTFYKYKKYVHVPRKIHRKLLM